jgi:hypothetical protein
MRGMKSGWKDSLRPIRDAIGPQRPWHDRKITHDSLAKAQVHADALNRSKSHKGERAMAYQCRTCLQFHVGNSREATGEKA